MNPERAGSDWPAVVIAGAYQTGVVSVRNLKRRGVNAVFFDCEASFPGFRSVYGPARLCPDPDVEPGAWVEFMLALAREFQQPPALIASSDRFVTAMARSAPALDGPFRLSPGLRLQGQLADKRTQYRLAAEHGLPLPQTHFIASPDELRARAGSLRYPCLVKPGHFREWQRLPARHPLRNRKVAIAESPDALIGQYERVRPVTPEVIVQEIIQGADTDKRVYLCCFDAGGRRIASAMFRELRCDPVGFGPASVSEPVDDAEVAQLCDDFMRRIGYSGICEFEMKRDSRDSSLRLIEANPRLSGGGDAAPYAGVDTCWLHYLDLIGVPVDPVEARGGEFRHIVLRADARAIPAYLRAGLTTWRAVRQSYRRPRAYFDLDWHDWRYSIGTLRIVATQLIRGLFSGKTVGAPPA